MGNTVTSKRFAVQATNAAGFVSYLDASGSPLATLTGGKVTSGFGTVVVTKAKTFATTKGAAAFQARHAAVATSWGVTTVVVPV